MTKPGDLNFRGDFSGLDFVDNPVEGDAVSVDKNYYYYSDGDWVKEFMCLDPRIKELLEHAYDMLVCYAFEPLGRDCSRCDAIHNCDLSKWFSKYKDVLPFPTRAEPPGEVAKLSDDAKVSPELLAQLGPSINCGDCCKDDCAVRELQGREF
jgi:hypothetical protein